MMLYDARKNPSMWQQLFKIQILTFLNKKNDNLEKNGMTFHPKMPSQCPIFKP